MTVTADIQANRICVADPRMHTRGTEAASGQPKHRPEQ